MSSRSQQLFQRAQRSIPGGVNSPVRAFHGVGGDPIFFPFGGFGRVFNQAGVEISDSAAGKTEGISSGKLMEVIIYELPIIGDIV